VLSLHKALELDSLSSSNRPRARARRETDTQHIRNSKLCDDDDLPAPRGLPWVSEIPGGCWCRCLRDDWRVNHLVCKDLACLRTPSKRPLPLPHPSVMIWSFFFFDAAADTALEPKKSTRKLRFVSVPFEQTHPAVHRFGTSAAVHRLKSPLVDQCDPTLRHLVLNPPWPWP